VLSSAALLLTLLKTAITLPRLSVRKELVVEVLPLV